MGMKEYEKLQRKARKALKQCNGLTSDKWPAIVHEWLDHPITIKETKEANDYAERRLING